MTIRHPFVHSILARALLLLALVSLGWQTRVWAQGVAQPDVQGPETARGGLTAANPGTAGPIRLRQPAPEEARANVIPAQKASLATAPEQGEFEAFVGLTRFGSDLVSQLGANVGATATASGADFNTAVPADYLVQIGDEVQVAIWGSVDADLRLLVDRSGRITLPRVGPVLVAGLRHADLHDSLMRRVSQVFKNFELAVSLGRLRGVQVYVTGHVVRPGAYTLSALSTAMNAVMRAGGPAAAGSFRQIELRRGGRQVSSLDLYDLLLRGDRSGDQWVQADDVIHVAAVGTQVALLGSVNKPAVYELKAGETMADLLRMAGGLSALADRQRVTLERLESRLTQRIVELALPGAEALLLKQGDVVRVFSAVAVSMSQERQNKRVRVEGEVARPGEYLLPPQSTLTDALSAAGGVTSSAYVFGTSFTRESVRRTQQENYDRALRNLESDLARSETGFRVASGDEAAVQTARSNANSRLIERMRAVKPSGRIVLQLPATGTELPPLALEDGDSLYIPPRPTTVGVFGSVFNGGSYLYSAGRNIDQYLRLAGGMTKGADDDSAFVVRANGTVASARQSGDSWLSRNVLGNMVAEPGDTIFVPEEFNKSTFLQNAKDWTQVLYQLGIGLASFKVIGAF